MLLAQGKRTQAKRVLRLARDVRRGSLGAGHPDTISSTAHLANMLDAEGKREEAKTVRRGRCLNSRGTGSGSDVREVVTKTNRSPSSSSSIASSGA